MTEFFATDQQTPRHRLAFWNDVICATYAPCEATLGDLATFRASLQVSALGPLVVSNCVSVPITYDRRPVDLRRNPSDDFYAILMTSGETLVAQNAREGVAGPGDVFLYSNARPYQHHSEVDYTCTTLKIPRALAMARFSELDRFCGRVLSGRTPQGRIVGALMQEAAELGEGDTPTAAFVSALLDMIAASIESGLAGVEDRFIGGRNGKLLLQIQRYMRDNMENGDLGLAEVADAQNVSMRTLARLFADAGTTPMAWLQSQRLAAAYAALSERRVRNVSEAAFTFGFNDSSYFGKAFKKIYGFTPRTLLEED